MLLLIWVSNDVGIWINGIFFKNVDVINFFKFLIILLLRVIIKLFFVNLKFKSLL